MPWIFVDRDGDPATALSASLTTVGIDDDVRPAVALAALFQTRLAGKWPEATSVPSGDGLRVGGLLNEGDAQAIATALRAALTTPVTDGELPAVKTKLDALSHRPLPLPSTSSADAKAAALEVARCEGTPFSKSAPVAVTRAQVEAWRAAAVGEGRLAFGIVGSAKVEDAASRALVGGARWPVAAAFPAPAPLGADGAVALVEGDPATPSGVARVSVAFRDPSAAAVSSVAVDLSDARSSLAARLSALGTPRAQVSLHEVRATAHAFGGCLGISFDVTGARFADDAGSSAGRVAEAVALVRQEVELRLTGPGRGAPSARGAADPRDGAAIASWWAVSHDDSAENKRVSVVVTTSGAAKPEISAQTTEAIASATTKATQALGKPIAEARVKVERGQEEAWVLMASPCGTIAERANDAGLASAFVVAAATEGSTHVGADVKLEPWFSPDGVGIVAHGPLRSGESYDAQAQRIADAAARAFAAEPIDGATMSLVRGSLLERASTTEARAEAALASALFPDHPSWLEPRGTAEALAKTSDGSVHARGDDLRSGPIRVAVLANGSSAQGNVAAKAADRWIARRSTGVRACSAPSNPAPAKPGTYAVEAPGRPPEAALALRLPSGDASARTLASWWADVLGGDDGLLATALGGPGLARSWSARVLGTEHDGALAVRVVSSDAALDNAVAQTRALFDRLKNGSISDRDLARAAARRAKDETRAALDPRARLVATWTGAKASAPPSLDAMKSFAASFFKDDALVIVAARPPRLEPAASDKPTTEKSP